MARERSPNRDKAFELFKKANGTIMNREIAEKLEISEKTVGGWKSKDKWLDKLNGVLQSNERSTPIVSSDKRGAPSGNRNAVGNKGNRNASAPKQNKNAVVTSEHESIFLEFMTDDEKDLYQTIDTDPFFVLNEEVKMLRFRQTRMLRRVQDAERGLNENERQVLKELRGRKKIIESQRGKTKVNVDELVTTEIKEVNTRKIDDILRIEDALTRVSGQLTRAIKQLNDLSISKVRLELMEAQINYTRAQTTKALINKEGDETDGGTVINIIDDI